VTGHWSDPQIEAAEARGREMLEMEPRAVAARYDARTDRIVEWPLIDWDEAAYLRAPTGARETFECEIAAHAPD